MCESIASEYGSIVYLIILDAIFKNMFFLNMFFIQILNTVEHCQYRILPHLCMRNKRARDAAEIHEPLIGKPSAYNLCEKTYVRNGRTEASLAIALIMVAAVTCEINKIVVLQTGNRLSQVQPTKKKNRSPKLPCKTNSRAVCMGHGRAYILRCRQNKRASFR